jgi:primosomal protein N' (replication factor Y)
MSNGPYLRIAVDVPLAREFDYLPPPGETAPGPGCRVVVPFGRRRRVGIVMSVAQTTSLPRDKVRRSVSVLDRKPLLSGEDIELIRFTSDYYHHPVGEVCAAALPALLRQGKPLDVLETRLAVTDTGLASDVEALARRAPRQAELLEYIRDAGGNGIGAASLDELLPGWRRTAGPLTEKGLVRRFEARAVPFDTDARATPQPGPALNPGQRQAVATLRAARGFRAFLLEGITGSGKTEVYMRIMADVLAAHRQVLILVPEIGLTPQLVARLKVRLGLEPAVLHSGLTDTERLAAWRSARAGSAQLVVGTRSAVFTPLPELGLIVIDEEHDQSLKQQEGLRYSARDLAIVRAKQRDVPVILGSATPTLESIQHCRDGDYVHLELPERAGGARPPAFEIVDLARVGATDGLSPTLAGAIDRELASGNQALVYLNRRGFAPTLICSSCGSIAECERCDSRMTVHARARALRCHHCGAERPLPETCAECGAAVRPLGEGTQRIEETLKSRFPGAGIRRIDSDSVQHKGAMAAALAEAEQGTADILVGTQMLSKGHHFPKLTLVGVINADQGLFGTDFRSGERLAQSIIQVAGRAGRESERGRVIIQTAFAAHPFWKALLEGGYRRIADQALEERREAGWPPFTWLALIRASAPRARPAHDFLEVARRHVEARGDRFVRVLGPVDAPMARRAGLCRAQVLLQSSSRRSLHAALRDLRPALETMPAARRVRWSIDVDPLELF